MYNNLKTVKIILIKQFSGKKYKNFNSITELEGAWPNGKSAGLQILRSE